MNPLVSTAVAQARDAVVSTTVFFNCGNQFPESFLAFTPHDVIECIRPLSGAFIARHQCRVITSGNHDNLLIQRPDVPANTQ